MLRQGMVDLPSKTDAFLPRAEQEQRLAAPPPQHDRFHPGGTLGEPDALCRPCWSKFKLLLPLIAHLTHPASWAMQDVEALTGVGSGIDTRFDVPYRGLMRKTADTVAATTRHSAPSGVTFFSPAHLRTAPGWEERRAALRSK